MDVIEGEGTLRMPGQLHALPGGKVGKNLAAGVLDLLFNEPDFLLKTDAEGMRLRLLLQLFKLVLQFNNRLFKVELMFHSDAKVSSFKCFKQREIHLYAK